MGDDWFIKFWNGVCAAEYDHTKADPHLLATAIKCLGADADPDTITALRAAIARAQQGPEVETEIVSRKTVINTCTDVINLSCELNSKLDDLTLFSIENINIDKLFSEELIVDIHSLQQKLTLVIRKAKTFKLSQSNAKGKRFVTKTPINDFIEECAAIWMSCGHEVKTTQDGPFADFISSAYAAAFGGEACVSTRHLMIAQKYARAKQPSRSWGK